ncbi:hypothetical protein ACFOSC_10335 [Streptantibioticus rubrisoli]|uniref:Uncharacterized protein n=1 Tax=Streptantibioticus rubrisoli TaxID=1387313 RepID=A0ABT1PBF9_9ACTN|nr:hypothetical protein [Streptantibioticus rubrisoli]MCQ4042713.1 hypothetical protein [Streptantibioticus rubrisoli]
MDSPRPLLAESRQWRGLITRYEEPAVAHRPDSSSQAASRAPPGDPGEAP